MIPVLSADFSAIVFRMAIQVRFAVITLLIFSLAATVAAQSAMLTPDAEGERWARETLRKMTLEEKIGQMFMVWAKVQFMNLHGPEYAELREMQRKYHLGGWGITIPGENGILQKCPPLEAALLTNQLQKDSDLPLLFAADFERGLAMRFYGTTDFPHAMAFGATGNPEYARQAGRITGEEARAIGVQWNFFPDADLNSNPANPIINTRAYGEDATQVSAMVRAYIQGAHESAMLTTAKHFPGHGDTDTDTHIAMARVNGNLVHLETMELAPFREAVLGGVDATMIAHVTVPALDPDIGHIASLSAPVIRLLRLQLGFDGLVVTDAMNMDGLMRLYAGQTPWQASAAATVQAVKAGEDLLLIPADLDGAYNGLLRAVRSGEIPESRIDESVLRLLRAKAALGLHKNRFVDINKVAERVAWPESIALAQRVADDSITLVRDNHRVLPLAPAKNGGTERRGSSYQPVQAENNRLVVVVMLEDVRSEHGRTLAREIRQRVPDAHIFFVDERNSRAEREEIRRAAREAEAVIVAVYLTPTAGRVTAARPGGSLALRNGSGGLLAALLKSEAHKTVLLSMGSPYVAASYPKTETYLCAYSNAQVSEVSAVRVLFGEISPRGKLPVTIPGIAARGTGLEYSKH